MPNNAPHMWLKRLLALGATAVVLLAPSTAISANKPPVSGTWSGKTDHGDSVRVVINAVLKPGRKGGRLEFPGSTGYCDANMIYRGKGGGQYRFSTSKCSYDIFAKRSGAKLKFSYHFVDESYAGTLSRAAK